MGNKTSVDTAIKTQKNYYYPGEEVSCSVYINAPKPQLCNKLILKIQGIEECEFRTVQGNSTLQKGRTVLVQTFFILKDFSQNSASYLHGQYEFPCAFTLPYYLPGSFKEDKGQYKAHIYYSLKVIIVPANKNHKPFQYQQQLVIREPQREQDDYQYGQVFVYPKCLFWRNLGVSKVSCYFQKKNYLPNEQCVMICEVDNTKSEKEIHRVRCQFVKTTLLRANNGIQRIFEEVINTVEFRGARKGDGYFGNSADRKPLLLKYPKTSNGIHPSTSGNLVNCQYSIIVTPELGGCFTKGSKSFSVRLQILAPEMKQLIQAPSEWQPEVQNTSQILLNYRDDEQLLKSFG